MSSKMQIVKNTLKRRRGVGGAQKDLRNEMKMEAGYRARTHLSGCGIHATPRKLEMSEKREKNRLHSERDTLPSSKKCALLNGTDTLGVQG